jgi:penicillin-binding protein 2B
MVLSFKMLSGLDIRINGEGFVTEQSLSQGTVIGPDDPAVIQLQSPAEIYKPEVDVPDEESIVGG